MSWYEAAAYCNYLSRKEGIPKDQWCYEPNVLLAYADGMKIKPNYLKLKGYRLPTEAEWEYTCRAGSTVGRLRPNDFGMFDMLGNVVEWTNDPRTDVKNAKLDDLEFSEHLKVLNSMPRRIRGAAFVYTSQYLRCAIRFDNVPTFRGTTIGFRPARTME